jgi:hypothetical protein
MDESFIRQLAANIGDLTLKVEELDNLKAKDEDLTKLSNEVTNQNRKNSERFNNIEAEARALK